MSDASVPHGLVAVGRIIGAHGVEGEIRVKATSDVPGRFDEGTRLFVSEDGIVPEKRTYRLD